MKLKNNELMKLQEKVSENEDEEPFGMTIVNKNIAADM